MKLKICKKCSLKKPLCFFSKNKNRKDGFSFYCKSCNNKIQSEIRAKTPNHHAVEYQKKSKSDHYLRHIKKRYGISASEFVLMVEKTGDFCPICKVRFSSIGEGRNDGRAVDHCHKTGKIRGLICKKCNSAIGLFNDDSESLKRAYEYLKR